MFGGFKFSFYVKNESTVSLKSNARIILKSHLQCGSRVLENLCSGEATLKELFHHKLKSCL